MHCEHSHVCPMSTLLYSSGWTQHTIPNCPGDPRRLEVHIWGTKLLFPEGRQGRGVWRHEGRGSHDLLVLFIFCFQSWIPTQKQEHSDLPPAMYCKNAMQDIHVFLSSVGEKLCFLRKTFLDFSSNNGVHWLPSFLSPNAVSKVFEVFKRAVRDHSWRRGCHLAKR